MEVNDGHAALQGRRRMMMRRRNARTGMAVTETKKASTKSFGGQSCDELVRLLRGYDASILLNFTSASGNQTEKTAIPNQTLRGFGFIDAVKSLVEAEYPGVVSGADILSLVARDTIVATGGPYWKVPTGLFQSEAALTTNSVTLSYINQLIQGSLQSFFDEFASSMEKMQSYIEECEREAAWKAELSRREGMDASLLPRSRS